MAQLVQAHDTKVNLGRALNWLYLFLLLAINLYICRDAFSHELNGYFNSMHGQWMELARLAGWGGLSTGWWPYCFLGTPTEFVYAPLVPALLAFLSRAAHISLPLALNILTGCIYCLGPITLYLVSWRWARAPLCGFAAALIYSLLSPTGWVIPDGHLSWISGLGARRMYLMFVWDELPHQVTLALLPLAAWLLARALQSNRLRAYVWPTLLMSAMMLDSMFGVVLSFFVAATVPLVLLPVRVATFLRAAGAGICAYLLICPWVPPSLLALVRYNTAHNGEGDTIPHSLEALAIVALGMAVIWLAASRIRNGPLRWIILFACPAVLIPLIARWSGIHFLPQPQRYKAEMELAIAWLIPFALRPLVKRIPLALSVALVLPLAAGVFWQTSAFRHFAIGATSPPDVHASIEYRMAHWLGVHLPGQRVLLGGSIERGLNMFSDLPQLSGPYTTDANGMVEVAWWTIKTGQNAGARDAEYSIRWLQAMGVQAIGVPGANSPDFWKPYFDPRKFEGILPVLWREDDTTLYKVPQATTSLAHALRPEQMIRRAPVHGLDTDELKSYDAAINDPATPPTTFAWEGANHARIRSLLRPGDVVSLQIDYHPGWHARVNGTERALHKDGIGMITLDPQCAGDCEIMLNFDGGAEAKVTKALSLITVLGLLGCLINAPSTLSRHDS